MPRDASSLRDGRYVEARGAGYYVPVERPHDLVPIVREAMLDIAAGYGSEMPKVANDALIASAEALLNPRRVGDRLFGDVAATLVTASGRMFSGVCIDTGSGTGFCAEHAAVAAMVTAGEYQVRKIVAVWRDSAGDLYVLPPCGRCREFLRQIDESNLDTEVVLGRASSSSLRDLLPLHDWPEPLGP